MENIMKSLRLFFSLLCAVLLLAGCQHKESQEELFERLAPGVVVVLNRYYYEIQLPNGNKLYFSGFDENGDLANLTADLKEVQPAVITGTGFFIDKQGSIMTNRHVAQPIINPGEVRQNLMAVLRTIKQACDARMAELSAAYNALEQEKGNCYSYSFYGPTVDYDRLAQIQTQQEELRTAYAQMQQTKDEVDSNLDPSSMPIRSVCELGIAYNDTYVTSEQDFLERNPCVVTKVSDKEDVDLAVLQLKDKKTPEQAHVFALKGRQAGKRTFWQHVAELFSGDEESLKLEMGQQLYMIGYNAGLILGNTKQGLKAQMTSGKVTQLPDGQRLLYSIPTLQGSSGSPVVDESGNLVAVNFAKLGTTDNFNFGIPAEKISQFMGW